MDQRPTWQKCKISNFPGCDAICRNADPPCENVIVGDESIRTPMASANNDAGGSGNGSLLSAMSIGLIVLIVVLFTINLCIGIKRYWSNLRCARAASQEAADPHTNQEQNLHHVLFVNPGGSFQIGKRLKKDVEISERSALQFLQPVQAIEMVDQPTIDSSSPSEDQRRHMMVSTVPIAVEDPVVPHVT